MDSVKADSVETEGTDEPSAGPPSDEQSVTAVALDPEEAGNQASSRPWVTRIFVAINVVIFLGLATQGDDLSWETYGKFGFLPAQAIWKGAYWSLFTSAFVHVYFLHLAFNLYWLWILGSRLEGAIGALRYGLFFFAASFVSAALQLAVSDTTGIGASGAVYAIFGLMWAARGRYPEFGEVVDTRTIRWFVLWLILCVGLTHAEIMPIANTAHASGLVFGFAAAGAFFVGERRMLARIVVVALAALSVIPLFWCPWSPVWLSERAFASHSSGDLHAALADYDRLLELDPENIWALQNRSRVYQSMGRNQEAWDDFIHACVLDPLLLGCDRISEFLPQTPSSEDSGEGELPAEDSGNAGSEP